MQPDPITPPLRKPKRQRRPYGTGMVRQRPDGRWECRLRGVSRYGTSREDVLRALTELQANTELHTKPPTRPRRSPKEYVPALPPPAAPRRKRVRATPAQQRGKITLGTRLAVLLRDGLRCQLCGAEAKDGAALEIDHRRSVADGGSDDYDNLWCLCYGCNRGKGRQSL